MPFYSKKHYEDTANLIHTANQGARQDYELIRTFAAGDGSDNPSFLVAKFVRACVPKHLENDP